jgi:hypothetical protein
MEWITLCDQSAARSGFHLNLSIFYSNYQAIFLRTNAFNTCLLGRLTTPVQHVPKINADIPAQKVASEDHQRLLDR